MQRLSLLQAFDEAPCQQHQQQKRAVCVLFSQSKLHNSYEAEPAHAHAHALCASLSLSRRELWSACVCCPAASAFTWKTQLYSRQIPWAALIPCHDVASDNCRRRSSEPKTLFGSEYCLVGIQTTPQANRGYRRFQWTFWRRLGRCHCRVSHHLAQRHTGTTWMIHAMRP